MGDNFVATTYRENFKKVRNYPFFTKKNYEITTFCNSRFSDKDTNILRRLKSAFIEGLNKYWKLPKYIIIILEDDLIEYLGYTNYGISKMYGDMLEYLVQEFDSLIKNRIELLPDKAKKPGYPYIYWMVSSIHKNWENNNAREKFNFTLEAILKLYSNMRLILMKEHWDFKNTNLVINNRLTSEGKSAYWKCVDASIAFNISKRERLTVRPTKRQYTNLSKEGQVPEKMTKFFHKYNKNHKKVKNSS